MKTMTSSVAKAPPKRKGSTSSSASASQRFTQLHDQTDEEYACKVCNVSVEENGCRCDRCRQWVHVKCSGLSRAEFEALAKLKSPGIKYFCPLCLKDLEEGGDIDGKSCALEAKMDKVLSHLNKKEKEEKELENKIERIIERKVSEFAHEKEERAKRENNLVISGIVESGKETEDDQIAEDMEMTMAILRDSVGPNEAIKNNVTVTNVTRVGKKGSNPRIIKVTLPDKEVREHILKNSFKTLENHAVNKGVPNNQKVYINKDLTYTERQEQRLLREELKAKRAETGDPNWIIDHRGKQVVYRKQGSSGTGSASSE